MLNISNELKEKFKKDYFPEVSEPMSKTFSIVFDDTNIETIGNDSIVGETLSLTESLCSGNDLDFGACESAVFKCTVANAETDITGKLITVQMVVDGTTIPYGKFIIKSAKKQDNLIFKDIIAYDFLEKFNVDVASWYNGLDWTNTTYTLKDFRDSLCTYLGITQETATLPNDSMVVTKTMEVTELNGLDVLKRICQINGCFGHMSRDGELEYKFLYHTYGMSLDEELELSEDLELGVFTDYETITPYSDTDGVEGKINQSVHYEEYVTPAIDKVCIIGDDGEIGTYTGTGTNCYYIKDNFLVYGKSASDLETILSNISDYIMDRPYKPFTASVYGMPYLEVGDVIYDEETGYITYCLERTLSGEQSLRDSISAKGQTELMQDSNVNSEVIKLKQRTAKITKNVDEVSVELKDYEEDTDTTLGVYLQEILLRVKKEGLIAEINLQPGLIDLEGDRIKIVSTYFQLDEDGKIHATEGEFSGAITSSSINVNNVFVVDKDTGKVSIIGDGMFELNMANVSIVNGVLTCVGANVSGTITTSGTKGTTTMSDGGWSYAYQNFSAVARLGEFYVTDGTATSQMGGYFISSNNGWFNNSCTVNNKEVATQEWSDNKYATIEQIPNVSSYATSAQVDNVWDEIDDIWVAITSLQNA